MILDPSPKPVAFQDVAIGERVYLAPTATKWIEKTVTKHSIFGLSTTNIISETGGYGYIYPLETMYRK